jgi:hypothetical protein
MRAVNIHMPPSCLATLFLAAAPFAASAEVGGTGTSRPVSFRKDIAPLLQRRCVACHGEESVKGGYRLDSFQRLAKAGDNDLPPVVAGQPGESELYRLLVEPDPHDRMPQKADPLPAPEIALIERWIKEGATNDGGAADRPLAALIRETRLVSAPEKYARPWPVTALAFSPDGRQLAVSGYYEVTLWDVETGGLLRRIGGLPERITSLAWHPKTRLLAVAGGTPSQWGTVALVDPTADFAVRFLCDLPEMALSVGFNADGSQLAAGSGDRTIRFFDVVTRRQTRLLRPHADWVQSIAYSPDGTHLLSTSRDRTVRVANATTGEIEATYAGHDTAVLTGIFSRDGRTAFSLAQSSPVQVWDAVSGLDTKEKPIAMGGRPERLAWVSTGLAAGCADGLVRIYQVSDRQLLFTLYGHGDAVTSLAVGPSNNLFATGSYDGTVCIWDLACGTWTTRFVASPR